MPDQRGCNGKPLHLPSQPPHEYGPGIRPKDATDKEARTPRSRGRSVVVLYNGTRTHLSLNKDAPISRAAEAAGPHSVPSDPGWTASPICSGLICGRHSSHSVSIGRLSTVGRPNPGWAFYTNIPNILCLEVVEVRSGQKPTSRERPLLARSGHSRIVGFGMAASEERADMVSRAGDFCVCCDEPASGPPVLLDGLRTQPHNAV